MVTGNSALAATAVAAASRVPSTYRKITFLKRPPISPAAFASALITSTNTSTGATPFSRPTNNVPKIGTTVFSGIVSAKAAPITMPITMRKIRLMLCHFAKVALIIIQ